MKRRILRWIVVPLVALLAVCIVTYAMTHAVVPLFGAEPKLTIYSSSAEPAIGGFGFAMSDSAALKRARELWGDVAMIGTARDIFASNWYKQVGYKSPGCYNEFTILGSGFNTWDAAFNDASTKPPVTIAGPFKSSLMITAEAYDNVSLTGFQYFVDGVGQPALQIPADPPQQKLQVNLTLDTTTLSRGNHVLCAKATDGAGNTGRSSNGWLFAVDQAIGSGNATWAPNAATAGQPGVSRIYFMQNGNWVLNWVH